MKLTSDQFDAVCYYRNFHRSSPGSARLDRPIGGDELHLFHHGKVPGLHTSFCGRLIDVKCVGTSPGNLDEYCADCVALALRHPDERLA